MPEEKNKTQGISEAIPHYGEATTPAKEEHAPSFPTPPEATEQPVSEEKSTEKQPPVKGSQPVKKEGKK